MDDKRPDAVQAFLETIIDTSSCELTRLEHTNASEMAKVLKMLIVQPILLLPLSGRVLLRKQGLICMK